MAPKYEIHKSCQTMHWKMAPNKMCECAKFEVCDISNL